MGQGLQVTTKRNTHPTMCDLTAQDLGRKKPHAPFVHGACAINA